MKSPSLECDGEVLLYDSRAVLRTPWCQATLRVWKARGSVVHCNFCESRPRVILASFEDDIGVKCWRLLDHDVGCPIRAGHWPKQGVSNSIFDVPAQREEREYGTDADNDSGQNYLSFTSFSGRLLATSYLNACHIDGRDWGLWTKVTLEGFVSSVQETLSSFETSDKISVTEAAESRGRQFGLYLFEGNPELLTPNISLSVRPLNRNSGVSNFIGWLPDSGGLNGICEAHSKPITGPYLIFTVESVDREWIRARYLPFYNGASRLDYIPIESPAERSFAKLCCDQNIVCLRPYVLHAGHSYGALLEELYDAGLNLDYLVIDSKGLWMVEVAGSDDRVYRERLSDKESLYVEIANSFGIGYARVEARRLPFVNRGSSISNWRATVVLVEPA